MINDSKNSSLAHLLDPSPEQIRSWANAAVELMADYLATIRNRPVYPHTSSRQIREQLDSSLPEEPITFDELLHTFRNALIEMPRDSLSVAGRWPTWLHSLPRDAPKRRRKFKTKGRNPAAKRCVFMLPKKLIFPSPKLRHCLASEATTCA